MTNLISTETPGPADMQTADSQEMLTKRDDSVTLFVCGTKCEHDFSGPLKDLGDGMWSKVCAKCGASAFEQALWGD